jgi:hypothetical protein
MIDYIDFKKVELDNNVIVKLYEWSNFKDTLCLEYIERSPDSWYGDNEVSIDKEQAIALIALLQRFVDRDNEKVM